MPKIPILPHAEICPEGAVVEAEPSKSVCENLLDNNILVEHACEMSCACTTCHVIVTEGFDTLEESSDDEEDMLDKAWGLEQRSRLSCQLRNLSNDITIQFPRYTINMVSELHPNKHNLNAEDKKSLSKDDFSVSSSAVKHLAEMMDKAHKHDGGTFIEIYQNCNIFNDGAFEDYTGPEKLDNVIELKNGEPMLFARGTKGIKLDGSTATVVDMENTSMDDILIHDETNLDLAHIIANWTSNPDLPEPIGVIYSIDKPTYNQDMVDQINFAKEKKGTGSVQDLLNAGDTWKVE